MADPVMDKIRSLILKNKIIIFMKGDRLMPMCGFSAAVVEVFEELGVPFETVDVLQDSAMRENVKLYSNWPTIPQVYIDGKFIGGCDIVRELHDRGELKPLTRAANASNG